MGPPDGSIIVDTDLDSSGFKAGSDRLLRAVRSLGNSVNKLGPMFQKAMQGSERSIESFQVKSGTLRNTIETLDEELDRLGNQRIKTDQYAAVEKNLRGLNQAFDRLITRQEKLERLDVSKNSRQWKNLQDDIDQCGQKIRNLEAAKEALEQSGQAYILGADTEQYQQLSAELDEARAELDQMSGSAERFNHSMAGVPAAFQRIMPAAGRLTGSVLNAAKSFLHLDRNVRKSNNGLRSSLSTILKYSLGIRSLYILVNKLRGALVSGFQNLAQYSGRTNAAISSLTSALSQLKNSFATAFSPVLETIAPALTRLINLLSAAVTMLGTFFAALTGKSVMVRAKAVQEDYAASLGKTAKAAKEATRQLAAFDELNVLTDKSGDSGSAERFNHSMAGVPAAFQRIMPAAGRLTGSVLRAWEDAGGGVIEAWENVTGTILGFLGDIGRTFHEVFMDGYGYDWIVSVLELLAAILNTIDAIASAFRRAWNDDGTGYTYIASFFTMFTTINRLLAAVGRTFREAWDDGRGEQIAKNLYGIWTNINLTIANLAERIRKAWEDTGLGVSIWGTILDIVNKVLSTLNRITAATAEWAANLNFEPILSAVNELLKALEPLVSLILDGLAWGYEHVLLPLGKWTIEESLPILLFTVSELLKEITDLLEDLGRLLNGQITFDEFLGQLSDLQILLISIGAAFAAYKFSGLFLGLAESVKAVGAAAASSGSFLGGLAAILPAVGTALGAFADAWLVAYDVTELGKIRNEWASLDQEHLEATERYCQTLAEIYEKGGQEALNAVTGTNMSLEEAQAQARAEYAAMPHNMFEGFKAGWNAYFGENGAGLWALVKDAFSHMLDSINSFWGINSPSTVMQDEGMYLVQGLEKGISENWSGVTEFLSGAWENIRTAARTTAEIVAQDASQKWAAVKKAVTDNLGTAGTKAQTVLRQMATNATGTFASISTTAASYLGRLEPTASGNVKAMSTTVSTGIDGIRSSMETKLSASLSAMQRMNWSAVGSSICGGIRSGINAGWSALQTTIGNLASNLVKTAKAALDIHSPSGVFRREVGYNIGLGVGEGVEESEAAVLRSVGSVADAIAEEFAAGSYSIKPIEFDQNSRIPDALNLFSSTITDSFAALIDKLQGIADQVSFAAPAVSGSIVPYQISAEYEIFTDPVTQSLDKNTAAIIQAFISALGSQTNSLSSAFVAALKEFLSSQNNGRGASFGDIKDTANLWTRMFGSSPFYA